MFINIVTLRMFHVVKLNGIRERCAIFFVEIEKNIRKKDVSYLRVGRTNIFYLFHRNRRLKESFVG